MKRVALILICVAGLLASLPCFAAAGTPPPAPCNAVSPALQLAAPAPAPLPSWLAPQGTQPAAAPASTTISAKLFAITGCTIQFCDACAGSSCCRTSHGCVCC